MDLEIAGKTAVVTGGSKGIGKAIAQSLAENGCKVAIVARDLATCEAAAAEIAAATGSDVRAYSADTGNASGVERAVAGIITDFGHIDILVNSAAQPAGQSQPPALGSITDEDFFSEMNVKVMGYLRVIQAVLPHMRGTGFGRIINISGLAARMTGSIVGSIRNIGVAAMTKNVADELAGTGITANCIHPGLTYTERTEGMLDRRAATAGRDREDVRGELSRASLSRRIITAQEIAHLAAFVASPKSAAINGESIGAGGGSPGSIHY
jgi:NAD(P)-dependent dehydrogenase (short-subunit alcohol dehydrogenase family)